MPAWISKAGGNSRARRQAVRDSLAESYLKRREFTFQCQRFSCSNAVPGEASQTELSHVRKRKDAKHQCCCWTRNILFITGHCTSAEHLKYRKKRTLKNKKRTLKSKKRTLETRLRRELLLIYANYWRRLASRQSLEEQMFRMFLV